MTTIFGADATRRPDFERLGSCSASWFLATPTASTRRPASLALGYCQPCSSWQSPFLPMPPKGQHLERPVMLSLLVPGHTCCLYWLTSILSTWPWSALQLLATLFAAHAAWNPACGAPLMLSLLVSGHTRCLYWETSILSTWLLSALQLLATSFGTDATRRPASGAPGHAQPPASWPHPLPRLGGQHP